MKKLYSSCEENSKQALKRDMTPEQLYSVISDEIDNIYATN